MREPGGAERRISDVAGTEIASQFQALATLIEEAKDRLAPARLSPDVRKRLERAKAAADRGASLARRLPNDKPRRCRLSRSGETSATV